MTTFHGVKDGQVKISKRVEKELHNTKVVVRRLPPDMTEEKLLEAFSDIPQYSYFYFAAGDSTLGDFSSSRAYFSFVDEASIIPFRDKYDGFLLESVKGHKFHSVIEFSPYQGIPKRSKKKVDSRLATIEQDADYQMFLESLSVKKEPPTMAELSSYVDSLAGSKIPEVQKTPLIEYLTENHRRGGRTSKRSKLAGDLKKKRSKESLRTVKESRFKGEDGAKDCGGSKEWGTEKSKKEPREKGVKKSEVNGSSHSTAFSSSVADEKWLGSGSDRSKEKERGSREGGRGWREGREGGGWPERNGEGRREGGRGERGRRGGRGRKEGTEEGGGRREGGEGGSGYRERRGRQSGEEGKAKEDSLRNKDRPDRVIYSRGKSRRDYNHSTSTEVRKGAKEWEEGSHGQSSRYEGLKKREHVNGEKSQPRGRSGVWDEYSGGTGGKGWKHEGVGGGSMRGRNRDVHHESASSYHAK